MECVWQGALITWNGGGGGLGWGGGRTWQGTRWGPGETCPGGAKEVAILVGQYTEEGLEVTQPRKEGVGHVEKPPQPGQRLIMTGAVLEKQGSTGLAEPLP